MKQQVAAVCILLVISAGCSRTERIPSETSIPVKIGAPREVRSPVVVAVSGSVVSPENPSTVAFLVAGKVVKVVSREGGYVRRGEALAVVDPTDYSLRVEAVKAQAAEALAVLQKAQSPVRP